MCLHNVDGQEHENDRWRPLIFIFIEGFNEVIICISGILNRNTYSNIISFLLLKEIK